MTTTVKLLPITPAGRTMLVEFALRTIASGPETVDGYLNKLDREYEEDPDEYDQWLKSQTPVAAGA